MHRPAYRPVDQLRAEWRLLGRSPGARAAFALLACEPELRCPAAVALLSGVVDLGGLVDALGGARGTEARAGAAGVVRALLRGARERPLLARALLQALVPGLLGVAGRLRWGAGGDWEGGGPFCADLLATAWEVITEWSGQDRPYAVGDLLSAVRCRCRRELEGQRRAVLRAAGPGECVGAAP